MIERTTFHIPVRPDEEIYISGDIEADGKIPGRSSMLSIGAAAYRADGTLLGTFQATLRPLPGARPHPETMAWWKTEPAAWAAATLDPSDPEEIMRAFDAWIRGLGGIPVLVAYPNGYEYLFLHWYFIAFLDDSPFIRNAIDIRTYAMCILRRPYTRSTKKHMPRRWFSTAPHTHNALDDAIEQGELFLAMLRERMRPFGRFRAIVRQVFRIAA